MRAQVVHSLRGRLRLRYPPPWLRHRSAAIEARLWTLAGVRAVEGKALTGSLRIDYDPFQLAEDAIVKTLDAMTAELDGDAEIRERGRVGSEPETRRAARDGDSRQDTAHAPLLTVVGTTSVLATVCCLELPAGVAAALVLASWLPSLLRAVSTVGTRRRVNGDVLDASTLLLLTLRRNYVAGALLTWLRSVGDAIVAENVSRTRRSLQDVVAAPDRTVLRQVGDERRPIAATSVRVGDEIVIAAGQPLPADGTVVGGEALVNQQTMTGEALPVERRSGDRVFAATTVVHGEITIDVDRVGVDTAVGHIVTAVEAAADEKPDVQVFAERLADRGVGRTLMFAGLGGVFARSLDAVTAIMVADYGTAARVGIPTVVVASLRTASRSGMLIRGPRVLEHLARVDTVVFDKTGTLTSGTPNVTRVVAYAPTLTDDAVIRLAAAAEREFAHPVARAITRHAVEQRVDVPTSGSQAQRVGLGVPAEVDGRDVLVGSRRFMESRGVAVAVAARDEAAAHAVGASPTLVAVDGRLAGMLVVQDALRHDAPDAVRELRARAMRNVIMLSGDHPEASRVIAESLGLRHYHAELLPEDKRRLIQELQEEGRVVAMVGDGVNDALALHEADVGIAVPGGAEVAAEAADVVLLHGGLEQVVRALDLGRSSMASVRWTLGITARANLLVVGLASLGFARPMTSILLSHGTAIGAALMTSAGVPRA